MTAGVGSLPPNVHSNMLEIPQGTGQNERIGRKIVVKHISIKGTISLLNTISTDYPLYSAQIIRVMFVLDKQANGVVANVGDILEDVGTVGTEAFNRLTNKERFVTLKDWRLPLNVLSVTGGAPNKVTRPIEFHTKCNIPVYYGGTAGTFNELKSNAILAFAIKDTAVTNLSTSLMMRVRYVDS